MDDEADGAGVRFEREWFHFGIVLAILYAAFTLVVIALLRIDRSIGIVVAVGASIVFGVALMIYIVSAKDVDVSFSNR